jgi:hypothetical protein
MLAGSGVEGGTPGIRSIDSERIQTAVRALDPPDPQVCPVRVEGAPSPDPARPLRSGRPHAREPRP